VGALAARKLRIPVVVHIQSATINESEHKLKNRWNAFVESWLRRWTDCYVTVADSLQSHLKEKGVSSDKFVTLYNTVDVTSVIESSKGMTPSIHEQLGVESDCKLIGMVAFFRFRKGAEDLLQAVKLLGNSPVPYRLVMIGGGEPLPEGGTYLDLLQELAQELNIDQRVIFVGFKENVRQWMAGLDIFVLPSRFGEGLPLVVLEAMALQVPVIATPVEGTAEVLTEGITGLLPPTNNPEALAKAIEDLLRNPDKGKQLTDEAFRLVREHHDAPVHARKMAEIYDNLLK
jgi:glycosyltransferase involved in cell wall biosynthesis